MNKKWFWWSDKYYKWFYTELWSTEGWVSRENGYLLLKLEDLAKNLVSLLKQFDVHDVHDAMFISTDKCLAGSTHQYTCT